MTTLTPRARTEGQVAGASASAATRRVAPFDLVGDLDAALVLATVAPGHARAMLPAGLRLAGPSDRHPLLFVLGRQRGVRFALAPGGIDYLEFILALPFVERDRAGAGPAGPFVYLPRLFLDRWLPTVGGRLLLAYEKRQATIAVSDASYRIAAPGGGETLLSARFRPAPQAMGDALPQAFREILGLPVISQRARGAWRYTVAEFALEGAQITPIEAHLAIERAFVSGLPTGPLAFDGESGRAFRLRAGWRLRGPLARRFPP